MTAFSKPVPAAKPDDDAAGTVPGQARRMVARGRRRPACAWLWQPAQRRVCGCGNLHRGLCTLPQPYNSALADMDDYGRNVRNAEYANLPRRVAQPRTAHPADQAKHPDPW